MRLEILLQTRSQANYTLVEEDGLLRLLVEQWRSLPVIGIDTEFVRTNTFFAKPGLIQIATDTGRFLIDPLAISDIEPLKILLQNKRTCKVLHSCSEDLELFAHYLGVLPEPLFDTQVAQAFLNRGLSVSYKNTVLELCSVDLPKSEQRSDWLKRPLSRTQLDYAVLDIEYLLDIYSQQTELLESSGKLDWLWQECANLLMKQREEVLPSQAYLKVKGAWRLSSPALGRLKALAEWREITACTNDIPRGFLLRDPGLIQIAQREPKDLYELTLIEGIHPRTLRKYAAEILSVCQTSDSNLELLPLRGPLPRHMGVHAKNLKLWVRQTAERLEIEPELLCSRKDINKLIYSLLEDGPPQLPSGISPWKKKVFGTELLQKMAEIKEQL